MKRQLLQMVVEALLREGQHLVTKGGIVTTKTEILPYNPGKEWDLDSSLDKLIGLSLIHIYKKQANKKYSRGYIYCYYCSNGDWTFYFRGALVHRYCRRFIVRLCSYYVLLCNG